jgi:hypothetical protein
VKFVGREVLQWSQRLEGLIFNPVKQRAASPTNRTVAHPHMVKFGFNLESGAAAVAASKIDSHLVASPFDVPMMHIRDAS